nr:hypothetical protein [Tanacetum cinerariifolium]
MYGLMHLLDTSQLINATRIKRMFTRHKKGRVGDMGTCSKLAELSLIIPQIICINRCLTTWLTFLERLVGQFQM